MGLAAAYELTKQGYPVLLFEKQAVLGGLAASYEWQGIGLEKYYHFICLPDNVYVGLITELGLKPKLKWRQSKMSYFYNGELYRWGDPLSLMAFPGLKLEQKIRYGLNVLYSKIFSNWKKIEDRSAVDWLKSWLGEEAYEVLWKTLLDMKFWNYADEVSAAWIWSRIRRVANSRKWLFHEYSGYLEGGTATFIGKIAEEIKKKGGEIMISAPVTSITAVNGSVASITSGNKEYNVGAVISTIPLPEILSIKVDLPKAYRDQIARIKNIGVVCLALLLKRPLTDNFWLNIKDPRIGLPGLIEYTNLNDSLARQGKHLIYMPLYIDSDSPKYAQPDAEFFAEYVNWLKIIVPDLKDNDILGYKVFRDPHAQPVPEKGFTGLLPAMVSPINKLLIADTSYYFPEDRTIDQSITLGKKLAVEVIKDVL